MARSTVCRSCWAPKLSGSACPRCGRGGTSPARNPAYDDPAYRRFRKRVVSEWIAQHGYVCPGFRREAHASTDLTLDHPVPVLQGGALVDRRNAAVLCRSCNDRKRHVTSPSSTRPRRRAAPGGGSKTDVD